MRPAVRLLTFGAACVAFLSTLALTPPTEASGVYGGYQPSRLLRHRSGFLLQYNPNDAYGYPAYGYGYGYGYGNGYGPYGPGYAPPPPPGYAYGAYDYYRDFDTRRDRLLGYASHVDVSYLEGQLDGSRRNPPPANVTDASRPSRVWSEQSRRAVGNRPSGSHAPARRTRARFEPMPEAPAVRASANAADVDQTGAGWVYLEQGEHTKAIGRFTARLMRDPYDGHALIGFAITSAHLGDDVAAMKAMTAAVRRDADAVRSFEASADVEAEIRTMLPHFASLAQSRELCRTAVAMTSALLFLLEEYDTATAVLDALDEPANDRTTAALRALIASVESPDDVHAADDAPDEPADPGSNKTASATTADDR